MKIILASTSQNRRELFDRLGIAYEVAVPECAEIVDKNISNIDNIKQFSLEKAQSVYKSLARDLSPVLEEDVLILGFDSMVEFEGEVIGKPKDAADAEKMLKTFIGKPQKIISGIACVGNYDGQYFEKVETVDTNILFRSDTTLEQLEKYIQFNDWSGKCGSYSILGTGIFLLESIDGDFQNIIGVPVIKMGEMIRDITGKSPLSIVVPQ